MPDAANDEDRLWTAADFARFLGYRESTAARMASAEPDKLPPSAKPGAPQRTTLYSGLKPTLFRMNNCVAEAATPTA